MTRRGISTLLVCGFIGATGSPAQAGTYDVVACADAQPGINNSWSLSNNASAKLEAADACGNSGTYSGLYSRDVLAVSNAAAGDSAEWSFAAPADTSIVGLSYSRWLFKEDDDDWQPAVRADGSVVDTCVIPGTSVDCSSGVAGGARASIAFSAATKLGFGVLCAATAPVTCSNGGTLHKAQAVLYGATVTLSDSSSPALSNVGGSLFGGGYLRGSQTAGFDAADNVGIRSGRVYVDGVVAASTLFSCDFTFAVPCSNQAGAQVSVDTGSVSDGDHQVRVAAVDPAGNETRSGAQTITVDNGAPSAPQDLGVRGGSDWRTQNSFSVDWADPGGQVSPVAAAHYRICDLSGSCTTEQRVAGLGISSLDGLSVPGIGEWVLRVWLEDAAGNVDPASVANASLRYGSAPPSPTPAPTVGPSSPSPSSSSTLVPDTSTTSEPAPLVGSSDSTQANLVAPPLASPGLRLTSARYRHGRLLLRGRSTAAGRIVLRLQTGRRTVTLKRRLRSGSFRMSIRTRRPRRVSLLFAATALFRSQSVAARVR